MMEQTRISDNTKWLNVKVEVRETRGKRYDKSEA